ncbi:hypothetical protein, partial [Pseudomonas viridiflava]|uniref:hypothetical protein n=1 Tax=Pseudomonas viridiflava TaxID=33069 RepID=UPI0013D82769
FSLDNLQLEKEQTAIWQRDGQTAALPSVSGLQEVERTGSPLLFVSLDYDPYLQLPVDLPQRHDIRELVLYPDLVLYTDDVIARRISQGLNWS